MPQAPRVARRPETPRAPRAPGSVGGRSSTAATRLRLPRQTPPLLDHGHYPAPLRAIDVVRTSYDQGLQAGLDAERAGLLDLMETDACRNLMRLFFLRQAAKKWIAAKVNAKPREVKHAAVVGGGTMGAGIVHALVKAGIPTRLIEVDAKAAAAGLSRVAKMLADDVRGPYRTLGPVLNAGLEHWESGENGHAAGFWHDGRITLFYQARSL